MHSLIHLVDSCREFGALDNFSSFPFENYMQKLLKYVRKAHQPLQQVIHRYTEEYNFIQDKNNTMSHTINWSQSHTDGPLIQGSKSPQYKKVILTKCTLSCNSVANRILLLRDGHVFEVNNFCHSSQTNEPMMIGCFYKKIASLFNKPCDSTDLGIFIVEKSDTTLKAVPFTLFTKKVMLLPYNETNSKYVVLPLIQS